MHAVRRSSANASSATWTASAAEAALPLPCIILGLGGAIGSSTRLAPSPSTEQTALRKASARYGGAGAQRAVTMSMVGPHIAMPSTSAQYWSAKPQGVSGGRVGDVDDEVIRLMQMMNAAFVSPCPAAIGK